MFRGEKYITSTIADKLVLGLNTDTTKPLYETLSNREFQVMCLIASGKTVKEIGEELYLSVKTVSTYRTRILEKMKIRNNAELTCYAVKNKLVDLVSSEQYGVCSRQSVDYLISGYIK